MRILAIRGRNLASLEAEFELDLVGGALGGAGVFAIVGSTGADKSTLLDALCVALFDRTPRLGNHSRVQVSRGLDDPTALGAHDVRTLLRRGASSGWAEVDFEAGDGRRYRARWAVRRARDHSDGTMQDAAITLIDLDRAGDRLGGTKTETLKAIHARLGLTFDQFRRSALLAQGEFATFLRADGKDRSELLERMTGTEIYSKLSMAAHTRAVTIELALRDARATLVGITVLDAEARATTECEQLEATAAASAARIALAEAEAGARWLADAARHARGVAEADAAARTAREALAGAGAVRDELALRRRAEAVRAVWDDAARADRRAALADGELATAIAAEQHATAARDAVIARRTALTALHAPLLAARGVVGGTAAAGADLDVERAAGAAAGDADWLVANARLAPQIAAWPALAAQVAKHAAAADTIAQLEIAVTAAVARHRACLAAHEAARAAERAAGERLVIANRVVADIQRKRGTSLDEAGKAEDAARRRCGEVERLGTIAAAARAAGAARVELATRRGELDREDIADREARGIATAARERAELLRGERMRVEAELRRAAGYDHTRAELVAGEPCPLCGAAEHPWQGRGALDRAVADAAAQVVAVVGELDAETARVAAIDARAAQRTRERTALIARDGERVADGERAAVAWRAALGGLGELPLVADPAEPGADAVVAERLAAARATLEAARATRSQAETVAKATNQAQADVRARQADLDACMLDQRRLAGDAAAIDAELGRLRGTRAERVAHHAELGAAVDAGLAAWGELRAPAAIAAMVASWQRRTASVLPIEAAVAAALTAIDGELRGAERATAEHAARRADAGERRAAALAEQTEAGSRLAGARSVAELSAPELAALLAGSPAEVERLAGQLAALDRTLDLATALAADRARLARDHAARRPAALVDAPPGPPPASVDALTAAVAAAEQRAARLAAMLAADDEARARRLTAEVALAAGERAAEVDRVLGAAIGSHDGKLFRSFAQSLTLDSLLDVANAHLEELAPRYQLQRVPRHDLELQIIDRDLGSEVRSVHSLSGGESFLVSLALALGLSSMSAHDVRVRTLLIDEGFGTLDPATLDGALAVLDALQATGRQVGVISHVPALIERVGAHVRVIPRGGGRSDVVVGV
jgi:DNA repair protein SbcC/Rad50